MGGTEVGQSAPKFIAATFALDSLENFQLFKLLATSMQPNPTIIRYFVFAENG